MNMFARFDENPAMTLRVIKKTQHYGHTDNVKTVYPPQTKFVGGIIREPIMISPIQHFKADFLWKVSLKILNLGIILKTFTHVKVNHVVIVYIQRWHSCISSVAICFQ